MPWDPLGVWPDERRWIWAALALWLAVFLGPGFVEQLSLGDWRSRPCLPDFAQEWSSARSYLSGLPIYGDLVASMQRFTGMHLDVSRNLIFINAHPPASVLLVLPLARLDFDTAFFVWNLLSLPLLALSVWMVGRSLRIPFRRWAIFPAAVLLLPCGSLHHQLYQGQLNLVLLPLLCGTWAAERSGRPRLAGVLLGAATAIKLFPAFLLAYYALRRRWAVVAAGVASASLLTGLTLALFGWQTHWTYFHTVLPEIYWFRVCWTNDSLAGFWYRLFDPAPWKERIFSLSEPLWYSPALARAGYWTSAGLVSVFAAQVVSRSRSPQNDDRAFGLAVTTMLLVSPICWEHYLLLLLVPLAVCWRDIRPGQPAGWLFGLIVAGVWLDPRVVWILTGGECHVARPIENLTVISYQFYALFGLFLLSVKMLRKFGDGAPAGSLARAA
ncbi:MAG: glycosyltransferase family 87 protein [Isosphaeraceae bacterium]